MNSEQFQKKLIELDACPDAKEWALGKSWEEVYNTCHRGDWLLWLFEKTNDMTIDSKDFRLINLAAGHCANLVRHLMKDEKIINDVDATIRYGNGEISIKVPAYEAYDAAVYASYASYVVYDDAYDGDHDAAISAKKEIQQKTADIVRSIIKIENYNL